MLENSTTIFRLVRIAEGKEPGSAGHNWRVGQYSRFVARLLGFGELDSKALGEAAMLHDLGKIGVPTAILQKPGPLTEDEWAIMKRHARIGANLMKTELAKEIAMTHHERWDGTGYPLQLSGDRIPIASRIVMLSDQYDALRSARPYKPAYSHDQAANVILKGDGRTKREHFDPQLLRLFRSFQFQFDTIFNQELPAGLVVKPSVEKELSPLL